MYNLQNNTLIYYYTYNIYIYILIYIYRLDSIHIIYSVYYRYISLWHSHHFPLRSGGAGPATGGRPVAGRCKRPRGDAAVRHGAAGPSAGGEARDSMGFKVCIVNDMEYKVYIEVS